MKQKRRQLIGVSHLIIEPDAKKLFGSPFSGSFGPSLLLLGMSTEGSNEIASFNSRCLRLRLNAIVPALTTMMRAIIPMNANMMPDNSSLDPGFGTVAVSLGSADAVTSLVIVWMTRVTAEDAPVLTGISTSGVILLSTMVGSSSSVVGMDVEGSSDSEVE